MITMEEAVAAGDGTLHGAIDYWQEKHAKLKAELEAYLATHSLSAQVAYRDIRRIIEKNS